MTRAIVAFEILGVLALTGCMYVAPPPSGLDASKAISGELKPRENEGVAAVQLSQLVPEDWAKVVIACAGTSPLAVDDALGFHWSRSVEATRSDFLAMLIFVKGTNVVDYVDVGSNEFASSIYFIPCPLSDGARPHKEPPIVLNRSDASIPFSFSTANQYWYLSKESYETLLSGSR